MRSISSGSRSAGDGDRTMAWPAWTKNVNTGPPGESQKMTICLSCDVLRKRGTRGAGCQETVGLQFAGIWSTRPGGCGSIGVEDGPRPQIRFAVPAVARLIGGKGSGKLAGSPGQLQCSLLALARQSDSHLFHGRLQLAQRPWR